MTMARLYPIAVAVLLAKCMIRFRSKQSVWAGAPLSRFAAYVLLALAPLAAFRVEQYFLFTFYLLYLLCCVVQERVVPVAACCVNREVRVRFLIFGSLHLCTLGILALLAPQGLGQVLNDPAWPLLGVIITAALLALSNLLVFRQGTFGIVLQQGQKKDFRYLFYFLNLGVCYIFEQSILCLSDQTHNIYLAYFLCGNIIPVVLVYAYLQTLYRLQAVEEKERSNRELERSLQQGDRQLRYLLTSVHFDELTGARSRLFLLQESARLLDSEIPFALVYIDLNGLKQINDTLGHLAGDQYLRGFATMMREQVRREDTVARFGGDEFVLLLLWCSRENAEKRIAAIQDRVQHVLKRYHFSAGCADTTETTQLDELISLADQRMYRQKEEGRAQKRA